jgi:deoxyribodipyrimidine photo-lyase
MPPELSGQHSSPALVWFRQDLRLDDNPALQAAIRRGGPVLPVFIWVPEEEGAWQPGAASRWWLHQSLARFKKELQKQGSDLVIRRGDSLATLQALLRESGADAVFWNRRYELAAVATDARIKAALRTQGTEVESFNGRLLFEPWQVQNREGRPFQVFTPFWKACLALPLDNLVPQPTLRRFPAPSRWPSSLPLGQLDLEPAIDWAKGIRDAWQPGEQGARVQLGRFLDEALAGYAENRDRPDLVGTSRLSPHLHFGEMSQRRVWQAVRDHLAGSRRPSGRRGAEVFLRELGWREFAYHLLHHFPHTPDQPLRAEFAGFPWAEDTRMLKAWQRGRTGYPLVDAGMRQLWATGWMHNRVRMVTASFLVKHLLQPWQAGAQWFWDTLVDADLANNTLGWQWTAGCGADAAPFFRIFNPVLQGQKFDPHGEYVRRWVPELRRVPESWIHQPWKAPHHVLTEAAVRLPEDYPLPIVDHAAARQRALQAFSTLTAR